jgi:HipA-like protein
MRTAQVFYNGRLAGLLIKSGGSYRFTYEKAYLAAAGNRPVSLTLPLREAAYESDVLFPAFVNQLSEGSNKAMQSRLLKIDENDYFGLLLATGCGDRIGPLTIKEDYAPPKNKRLPLDTAARLYYLQPCGTGGPVRKSLPKGFAYSAFWSAGQEHGAEQGI